MEAAISSVADGVADGVVDGADIGLLLATWGTADPQADLDGSGLIDGADLGLLLGSAGDAAAPSRPRRRGDRARTRSSLDGLYRHARSAVVTAS